MELPSFLFFLLLFVLTLLNGCTYPEQNTVRKEERFKLFVLTFKKDNFEFTKHDTTVSWLLNY